ncbi:MAG TPA: hypothetical protein VIF85_09750 [Gaiellaceae bacterium]|jgi:hypothetical protein
MTERAIPGCESEVCRMWWRERIAWANHSGRVLAGDDEHAEDGDCELRDVDAR